MGWLERNPLGELGEKEGHSEFPNYSTRELACLSTVFPSSRAKCCFCEHLLFGISSCQARNQMSGREQRVFAAAVFGVCIWVLGESGRGLVSSAITSMEESIFPLMSCSSSNDWNHSLGNLSHTALWQYFTALDCTLNLNIVTSYCSWVSSLPKETITSVMFGSLTCLFISHKCPGSSQAWPYLASLRVWLDWLLVTDSGPTAFASRGRVETKTPSILYALRP